MVLQQRRECPQCGGIGFKLDREEHSIEFHVPIGGRDRESVTINGEGNQYPDMGPGDVVLQLKVAGHSVFKRQGADLGMNYTLSLRQALCGYKIQIEHVSGRTLVVTPQDGGEVVQPGSLKVVHCKGMPQRFNPHIKGHLYIVMEVEMPAPRSLTAKAIEQFAQILPDQDMSDGDEGDEDEKANSRSHSRSNSGSTNSNSGGGGNAAKKGSQSQRGKKGQKGRNQRKNNRQNNRRKNQKNKNKKGKKGGGGGQGMFGGLHGAFGDQSGAKGGKRKNPQSASMEIDEEDEELIEEVECHSVDGNPKATPATASNYYNQDEEEDGDGVQCRQM